MHILDYAAHLFSIITHVVSLLSNKLSFENLYKIDQHP